MNRLIVLIREKKGFIIFAFLKVLIMILGLVTNIFIVKKLSVNDFGIFSVAFMFTGLVTTFGFSWSSSSILYYGSKEKAKYGNINKTFWARNIIIAFSLIITTIIFILFTEQINTYIGLEVSFLILIWLYVSVAEDYLSQYFLAVKNQLMSGVLSITAKIIYIALIIILDFDITTLIWLNIVSHSTVLIYILGMDKKDVGRFEFDKAWFKEILNFSLWQFFGFSGLYLINFGDTAVIKYFMTTSDVAVYNVAYKLFSAIAGFAFIITNYYASSVSQYFANSDHDKIKRFFYKERFYIFAISTVGHLVVMLFSRPIITTLYGQEYVQSVAIFNVLMLGSILKYLAVFSTLYYNTNNKHRLQQTINIFSAILNVVLDIVFIKIFGLIGPAIATTLTMVLEFSFSFFYCEIALKRYLKK